MSMGIVPCSHVQNTEGTASCTVQSPIEEIVAVVNCNTTDFFEANHNIHLWSNITTIKVDSTNTP